MSDDLPTIEYETDSGHRRRVSYERAEETARVVRREYRLLDDGWVAAGAEELRSLEIDGEARMPVTLRTKLVSND